MLRRTALVFVASLAAVTTAGAQDKPAPEANATAAPSPIEGLWELRMERKVWWPYCVPGSMVVSRGPNGLRASVTFDPMWGIDPKRATVDVVGDKVRVALDFRLGEPIAIVTGTVALDVLTGEVDWPSNQAPETCPISAYRLAPQRRLELDSSAAKLPLETDPTRVGIDAASLDRLIVYAGRYDTDSLVVVKDGRVVCDRTFLRPRATCDTDAVTQGVASLAIPLLAEDGKIPRDLDTPLSTWFPDWKTDARKSRITLRHVLTHTSGLGYHAGGGGDYLAPAVASAAVREPGEKFEQSAQAMELLAGIVAKAAGEQVDTYLDRRLFRPLGIARWRWPRDDAGNVPTYGALCLSGPDLARVGTMLADGGRWQDQQLVPAWWIEQMLVPAAANEEMGLAWRLMRDPAKETVVQTQERLDRLKQDGFADADKLAPMVGKTYQGRDAWWKAASDLLGKSGSKALYDLLGYHAVGGEIRGPVGWAYLSGSDGQYLLFSREQRLAVVRLRRPFAAKELPQDIAQRVGFGDLPALARALTW